jgi:NAD/NADP transhydrogenase alpha subunit
MAVDNLPGSLPRDASADFGENLIRFVLPSVFTNTKQQIIEQAMILSSGRLTETFSYLEEYLNGK